MTQLTEVCKVEVHPDTVDLLELDHREAVRFWGNFHNGSAIGAKFGLSIGGSTVNGSVNFIKKGHEEMIIAAFNKVNGGP